MCDKEEGEGPFGLAVRAHLTRVHLELSDDLDGYFVVLSSGILGTINITECAIPHLLEESKSFESWVLW